MSLLKSLPDRPITVDELDRINAVDVVEICHPRYEYGDPVDQRAAVIAQFVVGLSSRRVVAIHFDPEALEWRSLAALDDCEVQDRDELADVIERLDEYLEAVRDGDNEYGEAIGVVVDDADGGR